MPTKKKRSAPKRRRPSKTRDTLRAEYDFRGGVRGKYAGRYPRGGVVVTLAPDVAAVYASSAAANGALRKLIRESAPTRRKRSA
jgi:hypothetical protein